jgi:membrane protein
VIAIAGLIVGHSAAQGQLLAQVDGLIGRQGSEAVRGMIEHAQKPSSGAFASIAGVITLLFGASGVFGELRSAFNLIWDVKPAGGTGSGDLETLLSLGMVLAVDFSAGLPVVSTTLAALGKFFGGVLPMPEFVLNGINILVSLTGTSVLFALIFRYVPETRTPWSRIRAGAIATALLFTIGKSLIGLYLGKAAVGSAYGAAGSLVVVIVWVYYSAMIFLFGAEFTHVLARDDRTRTPQAAH